MRGWVPEFPDYFRVSQPRVTLQKSLSHSEPSEDGSPTSPHPRRLTGFLPGDKREMPRRLRAAQCKARTAPTKCLGPPTPTSCPSKILRECRGLETSTLGRGRKQELGEQTHRPGHTDTRDMHTHGHTDTHTDPQTHTHTDPQDTHRPGHTDTPGDILTHPGTHTHTHSHKHTGRHTQGHTNMLANSCGSMSDVQRGGKKSRGNVEELQETLRGSWAAHGQCCHK